MSGWYKDHAVLIKIGCPQDDRLLGGETAHVKARADALMLNSNARTVRMLKGPTRMVLS